MARKYIAKTKITGIRAKQEQDNKFLRCFYPPQLIAWTGQVSIAS